MAAVQSSRSTRPVARWAKSKRRTKSRVSANGAIAATSHVMVIISGLARHVKAIAAQASIRTVTPENRMLIIREAPARELRFPDDSVFGLCTAAK